MHALVIFSNKKIHAFNRECALDRKGLGKEGGTRISKIQWKSVLWKVLFKFTTSKSVFGIWSWNTITYSLSRERKAVVMKIVVVFMWWY